MSTLASGGLLDDLLGNGEDEDTLITPTTNPLSGETNTRIPATGPNTIPEEGTASSFSIISDASSSDLSRVATTSNTIGENTNTQPTRTVGQGLSSSTLSTLNPVPTATSSILNTNSILSSGSGSIVTGTSQVPTRASSLTRSRISQTEVETETETETGLLLSGLLSTSSTLISTTSTSSISRTSSTSSSSSISTSSSIESSTSEEPTSTTEQPTETSPPVIVTISAGKNVTLTSSIYSTPPAASATNNNASKEAAIDEGDNTSILNTENKLFPLGVILVVVGGIIALVTILWFLMKVFGITRRRQRLRGAIPSFVPPERIDFPDEKFDPYTPPPLHHQHQYQGSYDSGYNAHQRNASNSSWDYLNSFNDHGQGHEARSITPLDGAGLAGLGSNKHGQGYNNEFVPDLPPTHQNGPYPPGIYNNEGRYDYTDEEHQPQQQQYNPFMIDQPSQGQGRDLIPQRGNSQSSQSGSGSGIGLGRQISLNRNDAYGGVESAYENGHARSASNGSQSQARLGKGKNWEAAGGYV